MNIAAIQQISSKLLAQVDKLQPLWWLLVRIWIASVFFKSGLTKIEDFETTIYLFKEEYNVPFIPPYFAALSGTFFELVCPVLLVLGLATRLAAAPLLVMTIVIQLTYEDHITHYYWGILLIGLVLHGGGKLSADRNIDNKLEQSPTPYLHEQ